MNSSKFIHVVCWLVQNNQQPMDRENLYQRMASGLWPNTKIRMQRWKAFASESESTLRTKLHKRSDSQDPGWVKFLSLYHEIILSETLSKVFCATVMSQTQCDDVRDIVGDIISDNSAMRKRALHITQSAPVVLKQLMARTTELRVLNEHITDLMLSQLPNRDVARMFAINLDAFDEFVKCAGPYRADVIRQANVALGLAFSSGIQNLAHPTQCNEDINQKIVQDVAELFTDAGRAGFPGYTESMLVGV